MLVFGKAGGVYENDYQHAQYVEKKKPIKLSKKNILHLIKTNTTMMRKFHWDYHRMAMFRK